MFTQSGGKNEKYHLATRNYQGKILQSSCDSLYFHPLKCIHSHVGLNRYYTENFIDDLRCNILQTNPGVKLDMSEDGVVRGFNNLSVRTKASVESRYVAKAYSNMGSSTLPKVNEEDKYTATKIVNSQSKSTGGTQKTDSGYGSNARLTSLSDWNIGGNKSPRATVERSHSYLSRVIPERKSDKRNRSKAPQRATSFQNNSNLHYYRPQIIKESEIPSRSNSEVHSHKSKGKSSRDSGRTDKKHDKRPVENERETYLHYAVLQHPKPTQGKVVKRSVSDASAAKFDKKTQEDPNALYARPVKSKRHSAEVKRRHDSDNSTPPPVPPPLKEQGVVNAGYVDTEKKRGRPNKIIVEAVVEKEPRMAEVKEKHKDELRSVASSDPETSYSVKGNSTFSIQFLLLYKRAILL